MVRQISPDAVYVEEANYSRCRATFRWVKMADKRIYGYYLSPTLLAKIENDRQLAETNRRIIVLSETIQEFGRYAGLQL